MRESDPGTGPGKKDAPRGKEAVITEIKPPKYVTQTLLTLERHGYSAVLVGGCVRDILMGRPPNDWDVSTSAPPEVVMELFPKTVPTGLRHGTVTVLYGKKRVEVTTFRRDGAYVNHRRPEQVVFISGLREDLARRDFTMNAIALPLDGVPIDPYKGAEDIQAGIIRCVGQPKKRFREDALRMFRAVRFSAKLGFVIEEETRRGLEQCAHLAKDLSPERVAGELEKTLISPRPQLVGYMLQAGLLNAYISPGTPGDFSRLGRLPKERRIRWAGLCGVLQAGGWISSVEAFLRSLHLDATTVRLCTEGVLIGRRKMPLDWLGVKKMLAMYGLEISQCAAAAAYAAGGRDGLRIIRAVLKSGECCSLERLAISGNDLILLGYEPGVEVGRALKLLLDAVLEYPELNDRDILLERGAALLQELEEEA